MAQVDKVYHKLIKKILKYGKLKEDRTGTGTISIFGIQLRFDLSEDKIPLLTTKKMYTKGILYELFWFLGYHMNFPEYEKFGLTNIKWLVDNKVNIWVGDAYKNYCKHCSSNDSKYDEWLRVNKDGNSVSMYTEKEFIEQIATNDFFAIKWGNLGPVYGKQWIDWDGINQIQNLIHDLKNNPDSRRLMVTAWNPTDLNKAVLPPCHYGFQCWTRELTYKERVKWFFSNYYETGMEFEICLDSFKKYDLDNFKWHDTTIAIPKRALTLQWNQRSVDTGLGLPFNIASYAFLTHMLAHSTNMLAEELIFNGGDTHIYANHILELTDQVTNRDVKEHDSAVVRFNTEDRDFWKLSPDTIEVLHYTSYDPIKLELSN